MPLALAGAVHLSGEDEAWSRSLAGREHEPLDAGHRRAARASDYLLVGSLATTVGLSLDERRQTGSHYTLWNTALPGVAQYVVNSEVKDAVARKRPDFENRPAGDPEGRKSFYSGHTSNVAYAAATIRGSLARRGWPVTNRVVADGVLTALPAVQGYLRVRGKKHYPTDVLVGWGLGNLFGRYAAELERLRQAASSVRPTMRVARDGPEGVGVLVGMEVDL